MHTFTDVETSSKSISEISHDICRMALSLGRHYLLLSYATLKHFEKNIFTTQSSVLVC